MILTILGELMLCGAAVAGIMAAGRSAKWRWIGLATLAACELGLWGVGLSGNPLLLTLPRLVPAWAAGGVAILALMLFWIGFNCRKMAAHTGIAVGGTVLASVVFYFSMPWGFWGCAALIVLCGGEAESTFSMLGAWIGVAFLTAAMLAGWTWHACRCRRKNRRVLAAQIGIGAGIYAVCWLAAAASALVFGYYELGQAKKMNIQPWRSELFLPRRLDDVKARLDAAHDPELALPFQDIYRWNPQGKPEQGDLVPPEKRRYTLAHFDAPKMAAMLADMERVMRETAGNEVRYQSALNQIRAYAQIRAARAVLFRETGRPEKILPELMKMAMIDTKFLNDPPDAGAELTRLACRNLWVRTLVKFGPDDPSYAPVYREALALMASRRVRVALGGGLEMSLLDDALHFRQQDDGAGYEAFWRTPCVIAFVGKAIRDWIGMRDAFRKWENATAFEPDFLPGDSEQGRTEKQMAILGRRSLVLGTTAIALKLYRAEHGAYPDQLDKLTPHYLKQLPVEPVGGKALRYQSDGAGFSLSAVPASGRIRTIDTTLAY